MQQVAAQLPWFHNCVLLDKVADRDERMWYARAAIHHGWSRAILVHQIESDLHGAGESHHQLQSSAPAAAIRSRAGSHEGSLQLRFSDARQRSARARPGTRSAGASPEVPARNWGSASLFVGSQYPLTVGGEEFRIDLLFYHLKLRCYLIIDLKTVPFQPEFAGKMNFYLSAVNNLFVIPTTSPVSALSCAKPRIRSWLNMRSKITASR